MGPDRFFFYIRMGKNGLAMRDYSGRDMHKNLLHDQLNCLTNGTDTYSIFTMLISINCLTMVPLKGNIALAQQGPA